MPDLDLSSTPDHAAPDGLSGRQEFIWRIAGWLVVALLLWIAYRFRYDVMLLLLTLAPALAGAAVTTLRLSSISSRVNSVETWLSDRSERARLREGKFARFVQQPFFKACLAIWRWTDAVADEHLRAGLRLAALLLFSGVTIVLLITAAYIAVAILVCIAVLLLGLWMLSLWAGSGPSGEKVQVTRYTTDWLGRPKQEHFDRSNHKIGESRPDTDWLGRPKTVHRDMKGTVVGESRPDTDWLGNPKTVHRDVKGHVIGESTPATDWLGQPKTVHKDAEGNITGESRDETTIFGERQTVRYEKQ